MLHVDSLQSISISSPRGCWVQLVLKVAALMPKAVQLLEELPCEHFFVENVICNAPDSVRIWASRQFKNCLFVNASVDSLRDFVRANNDCFRFRGMRGNKTVEYTDAQVEQFLLFVHTIERNLIFCRDLPTNAKEPVTLRSGHLSGIQGLLSVSKNYVYRLFVNLLDTTYINIPINKSELSPVCDYQRIMLDTSIIDKEQWYVLYSRREKELYDSLCELQQIAYLPTRIVKDAEGQLLDRLVMRGYVFVKVSRRNLERLRTEYPSLNIHILLNRSCTPFQPMTVPAKEMEDFMYVNDTYGNQLNTLETEIQGGEPVELLLKGFEGIQGRLVKKGNQVQVAIGLLGHSVYLLTVDKNQYQIIS